MRRAAVRRLFTSLDLVGCAVLIAAPLLAGSAGNIAFPGAIGLILAASSFYWTSGDIYTALVGVSSFMLFAAFAGWGAAFWGTYSNIGAGSALALALVCVLVAIGFFLLTVILSNFSKDEK